MKSSYTLTDAPGADGVQVEFRPLEFTEVVVHFPELLNPAFPDHAARPGAHGVERARQRALEQAGIRPDTAGLDGRLRLVCKVVNRVCFDLQVHASWSDVPKDEDGTPMPGHFHCAQLGEDMVGLFEAILEASALTERSLGRVRECLEKQDLAAHLDLLGRRYHATPSEILGLPRTEPGSYVLDMCAAQAGELLVPHWNGKRK